LLATLAALTTSAAIGGTAPPAKAGARPRPRPPRLRPGDTIGLIEPASATDEPFDLQLVEEVVAALGLKSKRGKHVLGRFGYLANGDRERAADINAMFADPSVSAILAVRGGWGCARLLPFLDYATIRANPKLLIGYSDITALHLAIAAHGGAITLHGPNGASAWGKESVATFRQVAFDGAMPTYVNPVADENRLVQRRYRTQPITSGKARGRLLGGNLTVLTALVGTPYLPDFTDAILLLEDVDEAEYRIDRMLTQLALAGILGKIAGVAFGHCTNCKGSSSGAYGGFTITSILQQHIGALRVPAFQGSFFGHLDDQFAIPLGTLAEIDADTGTLRLLEPAVS
jgi:muramoyltetrapeptide carboxypeptidase